MRRAAVASAGLWCTAVLVAEPGILVVNAGNAADVRRPGLHIGTAGDGSTFALGEPTGNGTILSGAGLERRDAGSGVAIPLSNGPRTLERLPGGWKPGDTAR